jgi:hypothetical protein
MGHQKAVHKYTISEAADKSHLLMDKWRSERNLWISCFALTLYLCVVIFGVVCRPAAVTPVMCQNHRIIFRIRQLLAFKPAARRD